LKSNNYTLKTVNEYQLNLYQYYSNTTTTASIMGMHKGCDLSYDSE